MTSCLLVDDEPLARHILETYIDRTPELQLARSCGHAYEAFEVLTTQSVDLLFLDIQLPSLTGIEFLRHLKQPPAVIFTTAYPDYAVESYELEAVDYLLKPITYERFEKSLEKFFKRTSLVPKQTAHTYFKVDGQLVKLLHADMLYAQSIKDYLLIRTVDGRYITHMTMKALTELLPESEFRRVHRSFLVNLAHVRMVSRQSLEVNGVTIPIGDSYRSILNGFPVK
ncbi:LytR/AlgR family response regulator transcription factor [Spirosoma pomorum]